MRTLACLALGLIVARGSLRAETPPEVVSRAVDEEEILIVTGRLQPIQKQASKPNGKSPADPFVGIEVELVTERVLFGAPPPRVIPLAEPWHHSDRLEQLRNKTHIYVLEATNDPPQYHCDDPWDDIYPLDELPAMEALAQAHLDFLVLGSRRIVVAKAIGNDMVVERVLQGSGKQQDRLRVDQPVHTVPYQGKGSYIHFFMGDNDPFAADSSQLRLFTRWPESMLPQVNEALARRSRHPVLPRADEGPAQQILFLGPRAEALKLMQSTIEDAALLGRESLLRERAAALPDIIAAIEANLFREKSGAANAFVYQQELIDLAAALDLPEARRELARLTEKMLAAAEGGATFPVPVERAVGPPRDKFAEVALSRRYRDIDPRENHSLFWLLQTLPEEEQAAKYGERLMKLRDLAQYGWKDEADAILFTGHIADHLEFAEIEPKFQDIQPLLFQAGFRGEDLGDAKFAFSPAGEYLAAAKHRTCRIWRTSDWKLVADLGVKGSDFDAIAFTQDGKHLIIGGYYGVHAWDWEQAKLAHSYRSAPVNHLAVAGNRVFASWQSYRPPLAKSFVWASTTRNLLQELPGEVWYDVRLNKDGDQLLGKNEEGWCYGATSDKEKRKLPFNALDIAWSADGKHWWTLEASRKPAKVVRREKGDLDEDPFAPAPSPSAPRASLLRQRKITGDFTVVSERLLDFPASELLVAGDGRSVGIRSDRDIEIVSTADGKTAARWKLPIIKHHSGFGHASISDCQLSPDGRLLAVSRDYHYPAVYEARTGKAVSLSAGHSREIVELRFAAEDRELITAARDGTACRWDAESGKLIKRSAVQVSAPPDDRQQDSSYTAEDGQVWFFYGDRHGGYKHPSTVFDIRLLPRGAKIDDVAIDRDHPPGKSLGIIAPDSDAYDARGLVPGGKYLHFGTNIYRRSDLRLMSAANPSGHLDRIVFRPDGERYALVTSAFDRRIDKHRVRLRVYDTASGKMLFARAIDDSLRLLAFSHDGERLATVDELQQLSVWTLP